MAKFRRALIASAVALACAAGPAAGQFSNYYFFGDSSTDAGAFGARFTVNPGLVWAQQLGARYGAVVTTSVAGGNDYAQGGARVTQSPGYPPIPPFDTALTMTQQVSQLLAKSPVLDGRSLYGVSIGYNDVFTAVTQAASGAITGEQAQANVAQAAAQAAAQVARLRAAGAETIVVLNLYDTGRSPGGAARPATFTGLTNLYNSTLQAGLAQTGANVIMVNTNALFNEILANPAGFGFTNVSSPACTTTSSLQCTTSTLVAPNAGQTYLFADGVHPTPPAYAIMAQVVASMIEAPAQMSSLAFAPLAVYEANFRAIDGRMWSGVNSPRPMRKYEMWAAYDYSENDIDGPFLSGKADLNTIAVGGDIKLSERLLAGASFGYTENDGDFGGGAGGYKLRETAGNVYVGYGSGPWYVGAIVGAANLDYGAHRSLQLGALSRTESGDTTGWHYWGSVLGGYWFNPSGAWQHGPFGRLTYQELRVKGFSENSADSTALSYGEQNRESFVSSLGWQATGQIGMFRPFGRLTWEYEFRDNQADVTATPIGTTVGYSVPGIRPDDSYFRYLVGGSADFGGVTGFLSFGGTFDNNNGDAYAITVGVRIPM